MNSNHKGQWTIHGVKDPTHWVVFVFFVSPSEENSQQPCVCSYLFSSLPTVLLPPSSIKHERAPDNSCVNTPIDNL